MLWKKNAAGDLSWWPHARAARRRRRRAQNFATSGFHFIEASVNVYSQKKPLGLAMSLSPHRLAGKSVKMVGALSNTGLRVSLCLLFRLSQRLRDAYFLQK